MTLFHRTIVWFVLTAGFMLLLVSCSSGEPVAQVTSSSSAQIETRTGPTFATPEALRDGLTAAIAAGDLGSARGLWPPSAWDELGPDVMNGFAPGSNSPDCDRISEDDAHCLVFEQDYPRVLELTMTLDTTGTWTIIAISLESTN